MECFRRLRNWVGIRIMGLIQVSSIGIVIMAPLILIGISALDLVCFCFTLVYISAPLGEKYKKPAYVLVGKTRTLMGYTNQKVVCETV